jgi:hypothetical protein
VTITNKLSKGLSLILVIHALGMMLNAGCWMLDAGCWMLDAGCWMSTRLVNKTYGNEHLRAFTVVHQDVSSMKDTFQSVFVGFCFVYTEECARLHEHDVFHSVPFLLLAGTRVWYGRMPLIKYWPINNSDR